MSLYHVNKLFFDLNRSEPLRRRFVDDRRTVMTDYDLSDEEREAVDQPDIGALYVLGVPRALLMTHVMARGFTRPEFIAGIEEGLRRYGAVRGGPLVMFGDGRAQGA